MHYSIYAAGKLLAEFGREEVTMCIRGLQQYGISYEDALDQAAEIQRMYASTRVEPEPTASQAWEGVNGTESQNNVSRYVCYFASQLLVDETHLVIFLAKRSILRSHFEFTYWRPNAVQLTIRYYYHHRSLFIFSIALLILPQSNLHHLINSFLHS
jgi:hypothetical protein